MTWRRLAVTWRRPSRRTRQNLAISERLAGLDPANTGWQQDLAIAYSRVGDVAQARGDLAAAEQAYAQDAGHLRAAGRAGSRQHRLEAGHDERPQPDD